MKIVKIFETLDGECSHDGSLQWSVFVRLGGCNLRCWKSTGYCDAPHSLRINSPNFKEMSVDEVLKAITRTGIKRVTITGGEPMLQRVDVMRLVARLNGSGYRINLETSGSIEMSLIEIDEFDCVICDLKVPSSEIPMKFIKLSTITNLRASDYLKAVVSDLADLDFVRNFVEQTGTVAKIAVGVRECVEIYEKTIITPQAVVEYMQEHKLFEWRLNMQLHKLIWPVAPSGDLDSLDEVDHQAMVGREV